MILSGETRTLGDDTKKCSLWYSTMTKNRAHSRVLTRCYSSSLNNKIFFFFLKNIRKITFYLFSLSVHWQFLFRFIYPYCQEVAFYIHNAKSHFCIHRISDPFPAFLFFVSFFCFKWHFYLLNWFLKNIFTMDNKHELTASTRRII